MLDYITRLIRAHICFPTCEIFEITVLIRKKFSSPKFLQCLTDVLKSGPPVVMVLTGQSASEMEPWRNGSKIWTMVMTIVQNIDCNKLNQSNFMHVNLALWRWKHCFVQCYSVSVRNELREYRCLVCLCLYLWNTGNYCSNRVPNLTGHDRSFDRSLTFWPVLEIWPVRLTMEALDLSRQHFYYKQEYQLNTAALRMNM